MNYKDYINGRLRRLKKSFELDAISFVEDKANVQINDFNFQRDIEFAGNKLGTIFCRAPSQLFENPGFKTFIEEHSAQIACLLHNQDRNVAVKLDQLVEKLAEKSPEKFHWTGVYMLRDDGMLHVSSFRGEPTPHVIIPVDQGICGAAVKEEKTLNIADVKSDARYLSCSIKTKSEIVVPIFKGEKAVGEIDIDSHLPNAFSKDDETFLEDYAKKISEIL